MIWKNFVRDLRRTASRLISVSIITMSAVMVYTARSGILTNIERISASYLEGQNVADYWLTGVNLDQGDCRTLEGIAGVTGVQPRVVLDAEERHDSGVTLQLYAVPGDYAINTPYVVEGRLPESSREIVLSDTLAGARGLHPGDWYELTLTGTGRYLRVRISGLVKDPECLYYVNTTTPAPDLTHYAFAYGNETLLQELMGANCGAAPAGGGRGPGGPGREHPVTGGQYPGLLSAGDAGQSGAHTQHFPGALFPVRGADDGAHHEPADRERPLGYRNLQGAGVL